MFKNIKEFTGAISKKPNFLVDVITEHNENIANSKLNAFITPTPELALMQAKAIVEKINNGGKSVLCGLPLGVKDLFCTHGVRTTMASKMLENFVP